MPRLLPLVAVAAVGVLGISAIENGPGFIGAARSFAEGVAAPHPAAAPAAASAATDASATAPADPNAPKPAPICAESPEQLAKDAGMSPAELQVIQSLSTRRGELDEREQGLSTELALIQAAEAKVDAKIATMNALKGDMTTLLGQLDDKQQAEVDRLVKVYEAMKPAAAAERFVLLTDDVRLPIAAKMKEKALSAMIAAMPPPEAKRLTESLAARYVAEANATRQALNPTAPPAAAPPPAQVAQATPPANPAGGAPATAATPSTHHAPPHRRPHPRTPPAGPALAANTPAHPPATPAPAPPAAHAGTTPAPAAPATAPHG
jgi:flagellar motility protein MotE (MotC chaperone)